MVPSADRELVTLERDECLALLDLEPIGRLACASTPGEGPEVVPVNFSLRNGIVRFRTGDGELLQRVLDQPVSLEVDRFDWYHRTGWSVLVSGRATLVTDSEERELHEGRIQTWAPGARPHVVAIDVATISGRRIELHQRPLDGAGYL